MTKPVFDIVPAAWAKDELLNSIFLIEISEKLFGYLVYNKEQKQLLGLRQYHLDISTERPTAQALNEIISNDELLQQPWKEAVVIYNFPDSSLLPDQYFDIGMNKSISELLFGNAFKGQILSEKIPAWDVYNIYRVQRDIHSVMQQKFSDGRYWHYYSILLSTIDKQNEMAPYFLKCIFYPEKFVVAFFKDKQLQLLQTYQYETPEDVSYYLLKICRQFDATQENLKVNVAGLIEQQSALYTELLKYFQDLECDRIPDAIQTRGLLQDFPEHYFSPILKMAICV
ncbi:MAG: DUF3822 family protein [Chitinophagaceae bacterium]|nr:DUF3822 family protein [Chitinophagaceae bacterium]